MSDGRPGALFAVASLVLGCRAAAPVSSAPAPVAGAARCEVAVTVDDLPVHGPAFDGIDRVAIARRFLTVLAAHRLPPVYGFVNAKKVADDPSTESILRLWVAAGNPLGNHSFSHSSVHDVALDAYLADIDRGEPLVRALSPGTPRTFRYPFLFAGETNEKRDAVRAHLRREGYVTAEVTIDADDWAYNAPFARCSDAHDQGKLAELRRDFVAQHVEELQRMRALTRELAGGDVPQVLLLHVGAADADALDELLSAYEREGVVFVPLETALRHPFYASDAGPPRKMGAALPYLVARARGVTTPPPIFARGLEERLAATCR